MELGTREIPGKSTPGYSALGLREAGPLSDPAPSSLIPFQFPLRPQKGRQGTERGCLRVGTLDSPLLNQGGISWSTAGGPSSPPLVNKGGKQGGSAPGIEKELKAFSSFQYRAPGCGLLEDWASSRLLRPSPLVDPAEEGKSESRTF